MLADISPTRERGVELPPSLARRANGRQLLANSNFRSCKRHFDRVSRDYGRVAVRFAADVAFQHKITVDHADLLSRRLPAFISVAHLHDRAFVLVVDADVNARFLYRFDGDALLDGGTR